MLKITEPRNGIEYEIVVQYTRERRLCHDTYYSISDTIDEALDEVKELWHENNDNLFRIHGDIRFFMEVV